MFFDTKNLQATILYMERATSAINNNITIITSAEVWGRPTRMKLPRLTNERKQTTLDNRHPLHTPNFLVELDFYSGRPRHLPWLPRLLDLHLVLRKNSCGAQRRPVGGLAARRVRFLCPSSESRLVRVVRTDIHVSKLFSNWWESQSYRTVKVPPAFFFGGFF
jgi:hypothetical protein